MARWPPIVLICGTILMLSTIATANVYYVSTSGEACPEASDAVCQDLSFYINQSDYYFASNTVFLFLQGFHTLPNVGGDLILIDGVSNLTLRADTSDTVVISCESGNTGLAIIRSTNITIQGLHFTQCGGHMSKELVNILTDYAVNISWNIFINTDSFAMLFLLDTIDLNIYDTTVHDCQGYGLFMLNVYGINLCSSNFTDNNIASYNDDCITSRERSRCYGGNTFMAYVDPRNCSLIPLQYYTINIINSTFNHGVSLSSSFVNGGLGITLYYSINIGLDITIQSTTLHGNTGVEGANLYISVVEAIPYYTINISDLISTGGNALFPFPSSSSGGYAVDDTLGAGLYYSSGVVLVDLCLNSIATRPFDLVTISNSVITGSNAHTGAGGYLIWSGSPQGDSTRVTVESTIFGSNVGAVGVGMYMVQRGSLTVRGSLEVRVRNVTVEHCAADVVSDHLSAVLLDNIENAIFDGVMITDNDMQAIDMYLTTLTFTGNDTYVINNTGSNRGGALLMRASSVLLFIPPVDLHITDNTAAIGGALYVDRGGVEETRSLCFFQVDDRSTYNTMTRPNVSIYLANNTATSGIGDVLYSSNGGLFDCSFGVISYYNRFANQKAFQNLFVYNRTQYEVPVSSDAVRVCFCLDNDQLLCSITTMTMMVYPGDMLPIDVVTIGMFRGRTSGLVEVSVGETTMVYEVGPNCSTIFQPVTGLNATIEVKVQQSSVEDRNIPLQITLIIEDCPFGFQLSGENGTCECLPLLAMNNLTCNLSSQLFTRNSNEWIRYDIDEECPVIENCPFDYCIKGHVTFNITSPQALCALGRTGTLCGACSEGLSLMLGSNKCGVCSNAYISLVIPFAVAGIVLVSLLITLNLTVSVGAINGLIFYANIIKINEVTFFPSGPIPFLTQFISWINLDFGIETCFYDGLDSFAKTWLQFLFPMYIGSIVVIIILLSRRFNMVTKLTGNNAVPVLTTLLLLSYTKILRVVSQVMQLGTLSCGDDDIDTVWLVDGTVKYIYSPHASLFVVSILVFAVLAIPYTILHLLIPLLEKKAAHLKPYFDAQCGPFKDEYRFWGGLLLFARLVLTMVIPFSSNNTDVSITLLTVVLIISLAWMFKGIYQSRSLDALECWFHLNLAFVCIYSLGFGGSVGTIISVSLVFLTFLCILVYHAILRLVERGCFDKFAKDTEESMHTQSFTLSTFSLSTLSRENLRIGVQRYLVSQRNRAARSESRQCSSLQAQAQRDQYEESWGPQKVARRESLLDEPLPSVYNIINEARKDSGDFENSLHDSSPATGISSSGTSSLGVKKSSDTRSKVTYSSIDDEVFIQSRDQV